MWRYAAFLRGINLGRNRRVTGAELRAAFAELGFDPVDTFRASGNVAFGAEDAAESPAAEQLGQALERSLGFQVRVFLRSAGEVRAIAAAQPFEAQLVERSKGKLQVALLGDREPPAAREEVLALGSGEDRLAFGARELYWLPRAGISESPLEWAAVERLVGPTTVRTKGTIELLSGKFFAP